MIKTLDASFIIVNYNGKKYLKRLINSINNQTNSSHETIIVDNDSTDKSFEYINKYFPKIILIKSPNIGYGRGCNLGAKYAKGKFLIFLNPDIYCPRTYLNEFLRFYQTSSKQFSEPIGCLGSPSIGFNADLKIIPPANGGIIDIFGTPRESPSPSRVIDTFFSIGTGIFIKRDIFNKVKGFNPNIFLYGEEIDLCWRLKTQGYRHLIDNQNYIFHLGGGSMQGNNRPRQIALMTYGCFISAIENYQNLSLIVILPLYLIYIMLTIICLPIIKNFKLGYSLEMIKIYSEIFKDLKNILDFREFVQKNRTVSDFQLLKYISIVPSVFLH